MIDREKMYSVGDGTCLHMNILRIVLVNPTILGTSDEILRSTRRINHRFPSDLGILGIVIQNVRICGA